MEEQDPGPEHRDLGRRGVHRDGTPSLSLLRTPDPTPEGGRRRTS